MNSYLQEVEGGQKRVIQERGEIRRSEERGGQGIVAGSKRATASMIPSLALFTLELATEMLSGKYNYSNCLVGTL